MSEPEPPDRPHRFSIPAGALLLGLASLLALVLLDWIHDRLFIAPANLAQAVRDLEGDLATSHLWLEEYVTGDTIPEGELRRRLADARDQVRALLEGGQVGADPLVTLRVEDPELRARIERLREQTERFVAIAERRVRGYRAGEPVGIGSAMDQQTDEVFNQLFAGLDHLKRRVDRRLQQSTVRSRALTHSLVAAWATLVCVTLAGLWTLEKRQRHAAAALRRRESQIARAQKMEAVGRLAGGLAHDINNYLSAITGQAELVQRKSAPGDPMSGRMEIILGAAFRASELLTRLLAFAGNRPSRPRVIELNRVIEDLLPMARRLLSEDVAIETRLAPDLAPVEVDPVQVEQILINLLVNSREAMPDGGQVTIATAGRPPHVLLTVRDTGSGIPPELQDKIFEPFFTTKERAANSGLGLATVYAIVRQAGGEIRFDSRPGEGTTFTVTFPRSLRPVEAVERRHPPAKAGDSGTGERVLLVEDRAELRETTGALLETLGYRVTAVADGTAALRLLADEDLDIAVLVADALLAAGSGPEVIAQARELRPGLPALLISGSRADFTSRYRELGPDVPFLAKPFSAGELARKLHEVLTFVTPRPG